MVSSNQEYKFESTEAFLSVTPLAEVESSSLEPQTGTATKFIGQYSDRMTMYAPVSQVAEYLDNHSEWFSRCAEPMKVQPLGENGYGLGIGRFRSFGYEVEPKIGLELLHSHAGIYRIVTIPIPDYQAPGYDVDYRSSLQLVEGSGDCDLTQVEWELDLEVDVYFPKFINRLPKSLIQSTGDRLLNQIVRQVSRRLTRKVREDFHNTFGIPFDSKSN